jgi:hypothetical protein
MNLFSDEFIGIIGYIVLSKGCNERHSAESYNKSLPTNLQESWHQVHSRKAWLEPR